MLTAVKKIGRPPLMVALFLLAAAFELYQPVAISSDVY
jgi:hypothetical protein